MYSVSRLMTENILCTSLALMTFRMLITYSLVFVSAGVLGNSRSVNAVVLAPGESHRVLDAGWVVQPEEHAHLLTGHRQGINVPPSVLRAEEYILHICRKCLAGYPEGFLDGFYVIRYLFLKDCLQVFLAAKI